MADEKPDLSGSCPPHHWTITTATVGGEDCYHHICLRCAAQKDTPIYGLSSRGERTIKAAG